MGKNSRNKSNKNILKEALRYAEAAESSIHRVMGQAAGAVFAFWG